MKQKTALIIRHVPYEGVAGFRDPIEAAGYQVDRVDVSDPGFSQIDLCHHDLLIMMGGPMGFYEQDQHPWISCQLRRLAKRLEADRPTLGVCFGAQMIAAALGARVYPGPAKEVGFHPVRIHDNAIDGPLRHLVEVPVLHWHGDTFDLPNGVELLASSHVYDHQAFRRGANLLALQFHAEMGRDERFNAWIEEWPESVVEAGGTESDLRAAHEQFGPIVVAAGQSMIADWLEGIDQANRAEPSTLPLFQKA
ncbi:MAG: glutamine amidotransferase [Novosphingobium sp. 32-60-15]|uniref:glutamine amidotransferase n=1 Tax=unclassified Novosphingobium TaxID=2644732 RepID=UPI000BCDDA12|nr:MULTISPECIES: glutamine amidotransferase [unclassified Novosphingobium]OYX60916.1 MAG: glutamine amidotransferase [Novosphingobium sp. 32-60-15]